MEIEVDAVEVRVESAQDAERARAFGSMVERALGERATAAPDGRASVGRLVVRLPEANADVDARRIADRIVTRLTKLLGADQ